MLDVFSEAPTGIQDAPHDPRMSAAGHQVALRAVRLEAVRDHHTLLQEMALGLSVPLAPGDDLSHLLDALPGSGPGGRLGILLLGYRDLCRHSAQLAGQLERALLSAQARWAQQGAQLYLLAAYIESDPYHF